MFQTSRRPDDPAQLRFDGFPEERATDRLFFAVYPSWPTANAVLAPLAQRLKSELSLRGQPIAAERFHATVHFMGDYAALPPELVTCARAAGAALKMAPFRVSFDRAASFNSKPSNRPLVLRGGRGVEALSDFHDALGHAMQGVGLGRWALPQFTPHVTLLYDDRSVDELPIDEIGWSVNEFVLVHSELGNSRHVPLARWQLRN